MRSHQCVAFADRLESEGVFSFNHLHMTVREAFTALESFVDRSDPDLELPNMASSCRAAGVRPSSFRAGPRHQINRQCTASRPRVQVHALQTAERARAAGEPEWLVVTALIHDLGKVSLTGQDTAAGVCSTLTTRPHRGLHCARR